MTSDKLEIIFEHRETFMQLIKLHDSSYIDWPVDLSLKKSQAICRETALNGVEEMFEALGHLKNWKPHRQTEVPEIDREKFLEEIVDLRLSNVCDIQGLSCSVTLLS